MECLDVLQDSVTWCQEDLTLHILNFHLNVTIAAVLDPARDVTTAYEGKLSYHPASSSTPEPSFGGQGSALDQSGGSVNVLLTLGADVQFSGVLQSSSGQEHIGPVSGTCSLDPATGMVTMACHEFRNTPGGTVSRPYQYTLALEQGLTVDEPFRRAREQLNHPPHIGG